MTQFLRKLFACYSRTEAKTVVCGRVMALLTTQTPAGKAIGGYPIRGLLEKRSQWRFEFLAWTACQHKLTIGRIVERLVFPSESRSVMIQDKSGTIDHYTTFVGNLRKSQNGHGSRGEENRYSSLIVYVLQHTLQYILTLHRGFELFSIQPAVFPFYRLYEKTRDSRKFWSKVKVPEYPLMGMRPLIPK